MSSPKDELAKLSGLIVGKNVLQSPLDFWGRYDVWRDVTKGLEEAIRKMEDERKMSKKVDVTISVYLEIRDAEIYGGKGSVGYAEAKIDLNASSLDGFKLGEFVEGNIDGFAELSKVPADNIKIIPRFEYERNAEDPGDSKWIPVEERLPEDDHYILLSFANFNLPMVGRYETDQEGGTFYLGDCDEEDTCISQDLFVNAWRPLPKPYRPEKEEGRVK